MEEVKKYYAPEDGRLLDKGTCNSTDIPNSLIFRNHETKMVGVFPLAGIKDDSSKNGSNKGGNSINKSLGNDISKNNISEGEYYDTKNPYIFEDYHKIGRA